MTFVIAVALFFQLGFVIALTVAHNQVEKQFEAEAKSRKLLSTANGLILQLLRVAAAQGFYQFNKEEAFQRSFERGLKEFEHRRGDIEKLGLNSKGEEAEPEIIAMVHELDEAFKLFHESEEVFLSGDEGGKRWTILSIARQARTLNELNDKFVQKQDEKTAQHEKREASVRQFVNSLVYGGLAINITGILLLLVYFNRMTSRRFDTLSKNIVALGASKDLPSRLDGADELAMLDNVVHAVSKALKEAERSKQEVLAMVTHDLRSPLTSLQLTLNLLNSDTMDKSSDKAKNMLSRAESSTGKLIQLINDLLDIDKIESGRFTLDISSASDTAMIRQAIDLIHHSAEARKIKVEIKSANIELDCDEERIIRVITNLLSNAIKFSPDDSTIIVSTSHKENEFLLEVQDFGRGMPTGEEQKIFERYHQVNARDEAEKKGSGLGLTICKALIEAHGGTIGATSREGKGSTFWFKIPMNSDAS